MHSIPKRSYAVDGSGCICLNRKGWALNSAVECHLHTVEVIGSNPIAPTIHQLTLRTLPHLPGPSTSSWLNLRPFLPSRTLFAKHGMGFPFFVRKEHSQDEIH